MECAPRRATHRRATRPAFSPHSSDIPTSTILDAKGEKVVWNGQLFFNSGLTYAQIYAVNPSGGNSYIQPAHQYIAAVLSVNGASVRAADAAIANAASKFSATAAGGDVREERDMDHLGDNARQLQQRRHGPRPLQLM